MLLSSYFAPSREPIMTFRDLATDASTTTTAARRRSPPVVSLLHGDTEPERDESEDLDPTTMPHTPPDFVHGTTRRPGRRRPGVASRRAARSAAVIVTRRQQQQRTERTQR
jgi:hypothetical protein